MPAPPLAAGAVQLRATAWLLGVAVRPVGAEGTLIAGTTALDVLEPIPVPTVFVAVAVSFS